MSSPTGDGNSRRRGSGDVPHWPEDSDGSEIGKLGGFGGDFGKSACSESWAGWRRRLSVRCGISERFRRRWKLPERLAAVLTRGNRPMRRTERNRDDPVILWNYIFFWYRLCGWGNRIKKKSEKGLFYVEKEFQFQYGSFHGRRDGLAGPECRRNATGKPVLHGRSGVVGPTGALPAGCRYPPKRSPSASGKGKFPTGNNTGTGTGPRKISQRCVFSLLFPAVRRDLQGTFTKGVLP